MLCALHSFIGKKVLARDVDKSQGPFFCPSCKKELNIQKGKINVHHFAHKPPVTCSYGVGESEIHRRAKQDIYDALIARTDTQNTEIEKDWGAARVGCGEERTASFAFGLHERCDLHRILLV